MALLSRTDSRGTCVEAGTSEGTPLQCCRQGTMLAQTRATAGHVMKVGRFWM